MVRPEGELNQTAIPDASLTLDGRSPAEQTKIIAAKITHSTATAAPDIQKPKNVNPLSLPYFMVATIGMYWY